MPELWRYGEGTRKTEQTEGRWITYVATKHGGKKGVTAWRVKAAAAPTPAPTPAPAPTPTPAAGTYAPGSRTLRLIGPPRMQGKDVVFAQTASGAFPDGLFGPQTQAAVITYQKAMGLVPDGIVGPKTWAKMLGRG